MSCLFNLLRNYVYRQSAADGLCRKYLYTATCGRYCTSLSIEKGYRSFSTSFHVHNRTSHSKVISFSRLIQTWTERLSRADVPEAECSVNLIVAHAFGKKMIHEVDMKTVPSEQILRSIDEMCSERLKRVPVQYIIGEWDFHDMTLEMRQPVLIPRPETEELASIIVDEWPLEREQEGTFLEIGCGTGALSLYILSKLPNVQCIAVDKSETACTLTLTNASRFNLQDRIQVIHGDIFKDQTISELSCNGPYNVLVSNPPYLTSDEMDTLEKEVAGYEDHGALHGGTDGLDIICRILAESCNLIKDKQSVLWLEVGLEQPEKIKKIVELHPEFMLSYIKTIQDFTQRGRFCKLQLKK